MGEHFQAAQAGTAVSWRDSEQLITLKAMADPQHPSAQADKLKHMRMILPRPNDFVQAKQAGLSLPPYCPDFPEAHKDTHLFPHFQSAATLKRIEENAAEHRREVARRAAQAEEQAARRAQMSPLELSMEEVLQAAPPGQKDYMSLLSVLEAGKWDGEERRQVAENVKKLMQEAKEWREKSEKKRPEKDRPYQTTLKVMKFL